jgi:serine protease AprX
MMSAQAESFLWGRKLLIVLALILSASLAFAGPRKMSKELESQTFGNVDVIVQYNEVPTARHHEKVLSRGGKIKQDLGEFKGGAYTMPASELADLAADPEVVYISPDRTLRDASTIPAAINDYHTGTINASNAWSKGLTGAGIGVAVIDSGIASLPDITASNIVYSQDFTGLGSTADVYGHGTHVTGILAGNGNQSTGSAYSYTFKGIADGVSIINLRVLDANGAGTDSEVIAAIQKAIALKSTYNIRVINLSLGRPVWESYTVDPLCQAAEQAWKAGIVVVVAAGNFGRDDLANTSGYGAITAPGNDPYVITVGAVNTLGTSNRTIAVPTSYTSKGPSLYDNVAKPDLVAPGNLIISLYFPGSTLSKNNPQYEVPKSLYVSGPQTAVSPTYFILSGTSMAAPMVSAAAALMLQQTPSLTPDQIKARLIASTFKGLVQASTAIDLTTGQTFNEQADVFTVGAGLLDIQGALQNTSLAPATAGSALSPKAVISNDKVSLAVNGSSVLGTASSLWSNSILWGGSILWGVSNGEAGESILWGGSTPLANSILWGGSSGSAGESILWGGGTTEGSSTLESDTTGEVISDLE